jgi:hypothetical protein
MMDVYVAPCNPLDCIEINPLNVISKGQKGYQLRWQRMEHADPF